MPSQAQMPLLNHDDDAKTRCFTPHPFTSKPLGLFSNQVTSSNPHLARFLSKEDPKEALIFVYGGSDGNGNKATPDRTVYAYVWGQEHPEDPGPHHAIHDFKGHVHTHAAERAQLLAIITALRPPNECKLERDNHVVFAFSGDYILDNVALVHLREQVEEDMLKVARGDWHTADNIDLRSALLDELEKMNDKGLRVKFWQIDSKYNKAEKAVKNYNVPGGWPESDDEA